MSADAAGEILGDLDYPMLVVTAAAGGRRSGCLVGFASQCSISPSLLMVWISKVNHTYPVAMGADALGVHFLSRADGALAELFGGETGDDVDKFAQCRWHEGALGVPLLDACTRWWVGSVVDRIETGDHVGHLLEPVEAAAGPWPGQLPFQAVRRLAPGHPA